VANNMTDRMAALTNLCLHGETERDEALNAFETRFGGDALVMNKWFALQSTIPEPATLSRVEGLMQHKGFSLTNPNRVRAVVGAFASGNPTQFHRADGKGYDFIADMVVRLDSINPQVAARLLTAFRTWKTMEPGRGNKALGSLRRIEGNSSISPDVRDILIRTLE
jgi:aminopeptidase N